MRANVSKWGNSLAVRIPRTAVDQLRLAEGAQVDLVVEGDVIVLRPLARPPRYALDDLLAGMTAENRHPETATGPAVGNEV